VKPEVIDLDGGDSAPSRAGLVRGISIALVVGTVLGWAAISSTALRGPFATPHPSVALAPIARFTPAPFATVVAGAVGAQVPGGCMMSGIYTATVFVGGQTVTISRPQAPSTSTPCLVFWSQMTKPLPFGRIAR
jgi:hypothetical protein